MRLSQLYGKSIYDDQASIVGEVKDIVLDVETGGVQYLLTNDAEKVFVAKASKKEVTKKQIVPYEKVSALGDIVLVGQTE